ncbi:hypothetical protein Pmani_034440 [Petrolisthes manimaculis]|uniref:Uncharacterized protein n=1 Tax=Petrolisthes manimaculis TaxID=1843537 RepID=A0AAE1TP49_9EUCA|nr:hypothetical protein Pmani_034440 [Petrolisthes manimaculis]
MLILLPALSLHQLYLLYVHPSPAVPPKPNSCIHVAFTRSTGSQAPLHFPSPTHTLSVPLRLPCLTLHGFTPVELPPHSTFPHPSFPTSAAQPLAKCRHRPSVLVVRLAAMTTAAPHSPANPCQLFPSFHLYDPAIHLFLATIQYGGV